MKNVALVIGAGIGGIKASLDLAEAGYRVYLSERSPAIGGMISHMDRWFPDNHCGMCQLLPANNKNLFSEYCLRRGMMHRNIEILLNTEVTGVQGEAGDFRVGVSTNGIVDSNLCTGCGLCSKICPVQTTQSVTGANCKAIDLANPFMISRTYSIDPSACTGCGKCVEICPTGAIRLNQKTVSRELEVGTIILSTGFEQFNAQAASQYGYGRFPNVVTNLELERIMSPSGPAGGILSRPSDKAPVKSIAFLHCIGSRTLKNDYCSSACCMIAVKEAEQIKQSYPNTDVSIFFMDIRAFGKGHFRMYREAQDAGVNFIRSRVPVIKQDPVTKNLVLSSAPDGKTPQKREFDMVVLSVGQTSSTQFKETAGLLGIELNKHGFCSILPFSSVETTRRGIYVCGSASCPKDISETIAEAGAAAQKASEWLSPASNSQFQTDKQPDEDEENHQIGLVLCTCGGEISASLALQKIAENCLNIDGVIHTSILPYLCQAETQLKLKQELASKNVKHVVLGLCSKYYSGLALDDMANALGCKRDCVQPVNIRENVAWVHAGQQADATAKANKLVLMAVEKLLEQNAFVSKQPANNKNVLVIGGGIAGMSAALAVAQRGLDVFLVENTPELGGNSKKIYKTMEGGNVQVLLAETIALVKQKEKIHLYTEAEIEQVNGYSGHFNVVIKGKDKNDVSIHVGAIILATGAGSYYPSEYLYGQHKDVLTQLELEQRLHCGEIEPQKLNTVVMFQCIGSRNEKHPYCSRVCCSQALKNALLLKELNPGLNVIVFHNDIMSYGFKEEYYTRARDMGVHFLRLEADNKPVMTQNGEHLTIEADDPVLGGELAIQPDIIVLSTGITPENNFPLAKILGVNLDDDGFFKEAEEKFRPVDSSRAGIFICGLAHSPRTISESIAQARAAALRSVSIVLSDRTQISSNISRTNQSKCRKCEQCIVVCPYNARIKDKESEEITVLEALCRGCGACAVTCPSGAATLQEFNNKSVLAMVDTVCDNIGGYID